VLKTALVVAAALTFTAANGPDARLAKREILVKGVAVPGSDMPRAVVKAVIDAPPDKVWALIWDCGNYENTMPRILKAEMVKQQGSDTFCKVTTDLPFPLPDLTSLTRSKHVIKPGKWHREWSLIEGDYQRVDGSWTLTPFEGDPNRTLAHYQIHAEPGLPLPKSLLALAQKNALPGMIEGMRERLEKK
jgi:ribosome-associated toxin RatA of RatAB toxin-antitoxin module